MAYYKQNDYGVKYADIQIDNFRDLGGIALTNGRVIRDNMIFRSGELAELSKTDKAALDKLGIDCIFDLRSSDEVEYKPDYVPANATYYNVPAVKTRRSMVVKPDSVIKMIPSWAPAYVVRGAFRWKFKSMYRKFPFKNNAYKSIFAAMDRGDTFLFHCTAGKDRTGVASMLILFALGADLETVKADYMLSNFYRAAASEKFVNQFADYKYFEKYREVFKIAGDVEMIYFNAAYRKIIKKYKSVKEFLRREYNVDEQRVNNWMQTYTQQA